MNRRQFMYTLSSAAVAASLPSITNCTQATKKRPNIILIMVDDFGYECLSCNGSTSYKTPFVDELAKTGIRFTHCHSTPLCTPTRVQLMTGKYNFRNYKEFGNLPQGEFTFGHMMQQAGYTTCIAGKWQLAGALPGTNYKGKGTLPEDAGFDEHCLWQVQARQSRFWEPLLQTNGELKQYGKDVFGPDVFCDFITNYIEQHQEQPFFVYYPMVLTHDPFVHTPDSQGTFDEIKHLPKSKQNPRFFGDFVAYTDKIVGNIVSKLDDLGLRENTLVLFTGDNGTHRAIESKMGDQKVKGRKGHMVMHGTHVPLVANWEGTITENQVCDDLIDFTDFFPSLAELGECSLPPDHLKDGQSFIPRLLGKPGQPREWIYCWYTPRWGRFTNGQYVMDHQYKLYDDGRFYNIEIDRLEEHPLDESSLSDKEQAARQKLQHVLDEMIKQQ